MARNTAQLLFGFSKEQLAGTAIDVRDLNDAIRIAASSRRPLGSVEVRPMKELGCAE